MSGSGGLAGWRVALLLGGLLLAARAEAWDPPGWVVEDPRPEVQTTNPAVPPLLWALAFYQGTFSRVDGDRCPSYPTCSAYAREAVRDYGPFLGVALTAGRLIGEADEAAFSPRIHVGGRWKVYAPVENDLAFFRGRLDP